MIRFLQTPGPVKKIVLSGILLVFCGAMVITLIPGGLGSNLGFGQPPAGVVANVGSQSVTREEVLRAAQGMLPVACVTASTTSSPQSRRTYLRAK